MQDPFGSGSVGILEEADDPVKLWGFRLASRAAFNDARLNYRMAQLLIAFRRKPQDAIPQTHVDVAKTKAAYRFFRNKKVSFQAMMSSYGKATAEDCAGRTKIYAVQDTTAVNYTSLSKTTGLGQIGKTNRSRGLYLHTTLALQLDGTPMGLLGATCWSRLASSDSSEEADVRAPNPSENGLVDQDGKGTKPQKKEEQKKKKKKKPFEERESYKWIEGVHAARKAFEHINEQQRPQIVHVMDREGDVHEVMQEIAESDDDVIVRMMQNRNVEGDIGKAQAQVRCEPLLGEHLLEVPAKGGNPGRTTPLEVRAVRLVPSIDRKLRKTRRPFEVTLVEAFESNPPAGVEPIHWLLWTKRFVHSLEDAVEVIRGYSLRWRVEDVHAVYKSGCQIEKLQLHTAERLMNAIAIYMPVAVSVVNLRDVSRREPDSPCTNVLSDEQWQVLYTHHHQKAPDPEQAPPTMREAALWIGRLGGHLNRKHDGMPGVRTLWRGWRDLELLVLGYRAAGFAAPTKSRATKPPRNL